MGFLYLDSDKKIFIDPRYIGVVVERLLEEKFGISFDGSASTKSNSISDTTIAEIKVYCKDIKKVLIDFLKTYASMNNFNNGAGMQMIHNPEQVFKNVDWEKEAGRKIYKAICDTCADAELISFEEARELLKGYDNLDGCA